MGLGRESFFLFILVQYWGVALSLSAALLQLGVILVDLSPYHTSMFSHKKSTLVSMWTQYRAIEHGEEVCYRSDLPLWATPLTPWAPVATPNPLGRGAGAAGAKHHITCLFRQPAWKISSPHSTSFPRQFHSHDITSWSSRWTCLSLGSNEGNEGMWPGGKESTVEPEAKTCSLDTSLCSLPVNFLCPETF